jgi:pimeloyl-ACP methyl ester carboxylesterase
MMVGFTPNLSELEGNGGSLSESSKVSAVIEIAGVCDRRRKIGLPLALLGKGFEDKYDLRVVSSPIIYVSPNTVPVYILHGRFDSVADVSSATQLAAALEAAHVPHELHLVDTDHFPFSVAELALMVEWLKKTLPPGMQPRFILPLKTEAEAIEMR